MREGAEVKDEIGKMERRPCSGRGRRGGEKGEQPSGDGRGVHRIRARTTFITLHIETIRFIEISDQQSPGGTEGLARKVRGWLQVAAMAFSGQISGPQAIRSGFLLNLIFYVISPINFTENNAAVEIKSRAYDRRTRVVDGFLNQHGGAAITVTQRTATCRAFRQAADSGDGAIVMKSER